MMSLRTILSVILALCVLFSPITPSFSQGSLPRSNRTNRSDVGIPSERAEGGSFGQKNQQIENRIGQDLSGERELLFQSPVFSGLAYQIHVLGEVRNPGTYRFAASTRLHEAIARAGGILPQGSMRRIQVKRRDQKSFQVDVLSYELSGDLDMNPYLLDNDVVFIPLSRNIVEVKGAVKRPGEYELLKEKNLDDVVALAGGMTPGAGNPTPVRVVRFEKDAKKILEVDNLPESRKSFEVQGADIIVVPHLLTETKKFDYNVAKLPGDSDLFFPSFEERVFVIGAVYSAGAFDFTPYHTISHYVTMAGGVTKLAKKRGRWRILGMDGKRKKITDETEINPGDTIIIPERYLAPENWVSLVLGVSTSVLGITTTVLTLSR